MRMNLAKIQYTICDINSCTPTPTQIWNSIRNKDIPKSIRGFLWKSIHSAYKIRDFWENIPNFENRGRCGLCGEPKNMEHILLECDKSLASKVIWGAAKDIWLKREISWPCIRFGTTLGCYLANFKDGKGKKKVGLHRLFIILILESTHLIWKIHCE